MDTTLTPPKTCGHDFTRENCSSGSFRDEGKTFIPQPWVCRSCGVKMCDDCQEEGVICQCCGEAICASCKITARSRRIVARETRTEYLCGPCNVSQTKALAILITNWAALQKPGEWLDQYLSDLEECIETAKKAL